MAKHPILLNDRAYRYHFKRILKNWNKKKRTRQKKNLVFVSLWKKADVGNILPATRATDYVNTIEIETDNNNSEGVNCSLQ